MKLAIAQAILPFYNEAQSLENARNLSKINENSKINSKNSSQNLGENSKNEILGPNFNENSSKINENSTQNSKNSQRQNSKPNLNENSNLRLNSSQNLTKNSQKITQALDFVTIPKLKFFKISPKKYPIFSLKDELLANVDLGVIINAANEVQVGKFLRKECGFLDISRGIFDALNHFGNVKISALNEVFELHLKVGEFLKHF